MISNDSQNEKPDSPKQQAKASPRGRRTQRIRRYTQLMAAVLYNCHFTGFAEGRIYQGKFKGVCTPGLNCYSCPGAVAACPLGSLQGALVSSKYRFPYYILGTLLLMGLFLGRFICGFLCPFGLLQELLHKLPSPKIRKSRATRILSYGKYVILALFVVVIPLWKLAPGFCKYICPAGTFEAGLPLTFKNKALREGDASHGDRGFVRSLFPRLLPLSLPVRRHLLVLQPGLLIRRPRRPNPLHPL